MCQCSYVSADGKIGVWNIPNDGTVKFLGIKDVGSAIESISVDPEGDRVYFASGSELEPGWWVLPTNLESIESWRDAFSVSEPGSERTTVHNSSMKLDSARKKICCLCACPIKKERIVVSGSEVRRRSDAPLFAHLSNLFLSCRVVTGRQSLSPCNDHLVLVCPIAHDDLLHCSRLHPRMANLRCGCISLIRALS